MNGRPTEAAAMDMPPPEENAAGTDSGGLNADEVMRMVEAILFACAEPISERALAERLPGKADVKAALAALQAHYSMRGVQLVRIEDSWALRTAPDLGFLMHREQVVQRRLSRAALEVLATIAYHQPVTRAEIEDVRGVETSKGTLDLLLETGWVRMRGRRKVPGRPVTYGTTIEFLDHFGLSELRDLPGIDELKGAGLLSTRMPGNFTMPLPPLDAEALTEEEESLTDIDLEELGLLTPGGGDG